MRQSDIKAVFESKAYKDWRKSHEAEHKISLAICERLDNVIRGIGGLGKVLARVAR